MYKLAHISDVHLGPLPAITWRELFSKRIIGYINWQRNRRKHMFANALDLVMAEANDWSADHLAITGDMVNLATGIEIRMVADWLKQAGDSERLSAVPGNHDAYVPGAHDKAMHSWYPYVRGDGDPEDWNKDYKLFPYIRRRGPIAIIGCSTSIATPPFSAMGYFGRRQARETAELLKKAGEEGLFRVVMIHHPPIRGAAPSYKRMVGLRRFRAAISVGGAELVLHGHTHLNTRYSLPSKGRDIPVIGIASASQGPGGEKPATSVNLFEIEGGPGQWSLDWKRRMLDEEADGFQTVHAEKLIL